MVFSVLGDEDSVLTTTCESGFVAEAGGTLALAVELTGLVELSSSNFTGRGRFLFGAESKQTKLTN